MNRSFLSESLGELAERKSNIIKRASETSSRKVIQTRGLIAISARYLLRNDRWDDISVEAIAGSVGMVKTTVFNHYGNKADVLCGAAHLLVDDIENTSTDDIRIADKISHMSDQLAMDHNMTLELWRARLEKDESLLEPLDRLDLVVGSTINEHRAQDGNDTSILTMANIGNFLVTNLLIAEAQGIVLPLKVAAELIQASTSLNEPKP